MEKVERNQYQLVLAITGAWQRTSRSILYDELSYWKSLSDRRSYRRILQFHKILVGKSPSYLKDNLPPPRRRFYRVSYRIKDSELVGTQIVSSLMPFDCGIS